ncbi:permease [Nitzschia inconspicua]|uniref:Permease n=1 Tax=Nitzschia inconspicua TaxID=303405 RepID=A0A9K3Q4J9_9STRA|nr:permease [Nitzschia inconspicua]
MAGVCGSLAGMGGGFIMIPLMTSTKLLHLPQHAAHGTSLFAVATTGLAGALGYQGQVDYQAAACIALSGMVTARAGALATTRLSGVDLRKALGAFMLAVAPLVPAKQYLVKQNEERIGTNDDVATASSPSWIQKYVIPLGIGSCSGFLAGMFGVGGGAVVVPALSVLTDMNHYQALGTSLTAMVLPALSGTVTHFSQGNVVMRVAPFLATGAFLGSYAGSKLALSIDEEPLKYGFSVVMVVLGLQALLR